MPPSGFARKRTWAAVPDLKLALAVAAAGVSLSALAQTGQDDALVKCREIVDATARLRCYDELGAAAQRLAPPSLTTPPLPAPLDRDDPRTALKPSGIAAEDTSLLSQRWELEKQDKYGPFKFTYYRPNYLLPVVISGRINQSPQSPTRSTAEPVGYQRAEVSFQLSFKLKLLQEVVGTASDVWMGYTQQTYWQLFNSDLSREFRNTDFEPELIWVWPTNYSFLGLRGRMLAAGIVHQSNGRELPLSRSWNRAYLMAGFERDRFVFTAKVWDRISEDGGDDDNPDIEDYLGRAEILAFYRWRNDSTTALRLRTTFKKNPGWGSAQIDYRFPLGEFLRGYVQFFTGYGETLIDYNFRKNSIGIGISIGSWY